MRFQDVIFNNFLPKVVSLVLAISTWFYVFDLVNSESFLQKKEAIEDVLARHRFAVKEVPVKPAFTGKTPRGYRVLFDKVKVDPSCMSILAPESILEGVDELETERIYLGEYTRSVNLRLGIRSNVKALRLKKKSVEVYLPVVEVKAGAGKGDEKAVPAAR